MDDLPQLVFSIFNSCEGVLWISIAAGFAVVLARKRQNADLMLTSGLLFLAFGISDFVEIQTGGWYKPWWLLAWKAFCLVGFAAVYRMFRKRQAMSNTDQAPEQ